MTVVEALAKACEPGGIRETKGNRKTLLGMRWRGWAVPSAFGPDTWVATEAGRLAHKREQALTRKIATK